MKKTTNESIAPNPPEHIKDRDVIEVFYDDSSKDYIVRAPNGEYVRLNQGGYKLQLKKRGFCDEANGKGLSEIDDQIAYVQMYKCVRYAAPLAGYDAGGIVVDGRNILVTESPRIIQPKPGNHDVVTTFVENLLCEQVVYFWAWLKIAYECLLNKKHRPGQAVVVAGERDCGKSLLQQIITEVLGGRAAKPYSFMSGRTDFNKHLFMAEHLIIDDEAASVNGQKRRTFGSHLKQFTGQLMQQCHGKHQTPFTLYPCWRLTITLNDEPENMLVLPHLETSIEDKMILLRAYRHELPMPTTTQEERDTFWQTMASQLPALLHFLLNWTIPNEILGGRFGIRHFHHPELVMALRQLSEEEQLLSLIDRWFRVSGIIEPVEIRSEELAADLKEGSTGYEARQLLCFYRACGTYLARLAQSHPDRVQLHRVKGVSLWKLFPPPKSEE